MWVEPTKYHASKTPESFHEATSSDVIVRYATMAAKALRRHGTVDGVAQKTLQSPYDWYWKPQISSEDDIRKFMRSSWIEDIKDTANLVRVLFVSIAYSIDYMTRKWYYVPQKIRNWAIASIPWLIKFFQWMSTYSQEKDIEAASVFLKFLRATYQTFTLKKNNWKHVFNFETGQIWFKDIEFIKSIMTFFNGENFHYKKSHNIKFSSDSNTASGMTDASGKPVPFIARFRPKTIDSQICKWVSQYSYDTLDALKDRNALRIEVNSLEDIPHIILVLVESWLFHDLSKVSIEQKGELFPKKSDSNPEWSSEWNKFLSTYIAHKDPEIQKLFAEVPTEKVKPNTIPERQEVKLVSSHPSFEVQIMLVTNTNNTWWKADPFYKMKEDIDEEIRVNQWYIHKRRVLEHIKRWLPKLKVYDIKWINTDMIFERFLVTDKKIIPLYPTQDVRQGTWPKHAEFFTNKDFISRSIHIRKNNIPWSFWSHEAGIWISLDSIISNRASFPSKHSSSSQLPFKDQSRVILVKKGDAIPSE